MPLGQGHTYTHTHAHKHTDVHGQKQFQETRHALQALFKTKKADLVRDILQNFFEKFVESRDLIISG